MTTDQHAAESVPADRATAFQTGGAVTTGRRLRIVAVSGSALRSELLEALAVRDGYCDDIFVETISGAYWRIREVMPDLVVIFMDIEDASACELMTLLHTDPKLRHIPVEMCTTGTERACPRIARGGDPDARYSSLARA